MPSATVENYVKRLYAEEQKLDSGDVLVPMGRLAEVMGVVPGTATSMVKTLADAGLVEYEPRGGVRLTGRGRSLALHVLRRHRIIEAFLVDVLKLDWSEVHAEAEELEHVVSDKVLERLDSLLGHPALDPHGDPIPPARASAEPSRQTRPLNEMPEGVRATVARIVDQTPSFLRFAQRHGLLPGVQVTLLRRDDLADSVEISIDDPPHTVTLGTPAAAKIRVESPEAE